MIINQHSSNSSDKELMFFKGLDAYLYTSHSLCLLLLASSFIFYRLVHAKETLMPVNSSVFISISFIIISILISLNTFIMTEKEINNYFKNKSIKDVYSNKIIYHRIVLSFFIFLNLFICYLLIKYK